MDLYGVLGERRDTILRKRRDKAEPLQHPTLPTITIRDQKPMKYLLDKIEPSSSVEHYLTAINARVFFWASPSRLAKLLAAREYRHQPQVVLHVDTGRLLDAYADRIELCRFNSGAITQVNHPPRGHRSWMPIASYPFDEYRRRFGRANALAEVTVVGGVPTVLDLTHTVEFPSPMPA